MTALLSARTQTENLGDYVLNRALVEILSRREDVYVVARRSDLEFSRMLVAGTSAQVATIASVSAVRAMLGGVRSSGSVLLNPGAHHASARAWWRLLLYRMRPLQRVLAPRAIGVSFEPGTARACETHRNVTPNFLLHPIATVVRDDVSRTEALSLGIPSVTLAPDLAFAFGWQARSHLRSDGRNGRPKVLLSLRSDRQADASDLEAVERLVPTLKVVADVTVSAQVLRDVPAMEALARREGWRWTGCLPASANGLTAAFDLYSSADWVISNRLHVLILAAMAGAMPTLLPDVSAKVTRGLAGAGLDDVWLDLAEASSAIELSRYPGEARMARLEELVRSAQCRAISAASTPGLGRT